MKRCVAWVALLIGLAAQAVPAERARPVLLAYTRDLNLAMLIGQYDPEKKDHWLNDTRPFTPPGHHALFTLFGPRGKIQGVHLTEDVRMQPEIQPWDWNVGISTWSRRETHVALALSGDWPDIQHPAEVLAPPPDDAVQAVTEFLKREHLTDAAPRATQVVSVELRGNGEKNWVICANSDNSALNDKSAAAVYALALLRTETRGLPVTLPLRVFAHHKSKAETVDDFIRHHGRIPFYQLLAVTDLAGDNQAQIAILNDDRNEGPEIDIYSFADEKITPLLSARKVFF
jgi:hypothetical protein